MAELTAGETKLVQYLNEAYGLEKRLETALEAHIAMTVLPAYKKRLKQHLSETKRHGRDVQKRIKQLGGEAATVDPPGPAQVGDAAQAVLSGAQKAVALAQGPLHALRGTGQEEKHLKNAKTEYTSESEEIATYAAILALAEALGDTETQRLARAIGREEERMRSYLQKAIPQLTKAVAVAEIPASQRKRASKPARRKAPSAKAKATRTVKAKASSARVKAASAKAKTVKGAKAKPAKARRTATKRAKAASGSRR
jgi:ferritin-like metal-binding protein YciE